MHIATRFPLTQNFMHQKNALENMKNDLIYGNSQMKNGIISLTSLKLCTLLGAKWLSNLKVESLKMYFTFYHIVRQITKIDT